MRFALFAVIRFVFFLKHMRGASVGKQLAGSFHLQRSVAPLRGSGSRIDGVERIFEASWRLLEIFGSALEAVARGVIGFID